MINIVLGTFFGDEGKGMTTRKLAMLMRSRNNAKKIMNIKFNGGAQAGHTASGFVFHQFGSASCLKVPTYLSKDFMFNPMLFLKERRAWFEYFKDDMRKITSADEDFMPHFYINSKAVTTSPVDVFVNQAKETIKGSARNGSCGCGINETYERCLVNPTFVSDDYSDEVYRKKTAAFLIEKYNRFMEAVKIVDFNLPDEYCGIDMEKAIYDWFETMDNIKKSEFVEIIEDSKEKEFLSCYDLLFEGAQGMMLDMDFLEYAPNLTSSKTNSTNPIRMIKELGREDEEITTWYCIRTYMTRHGAGRFDSEVASKELIAPGITDTTNQPNEFQGSLRYGYFDKVLFEKMIKEDRMRYFEAGLNTQYGYSVSYADKTDYSLITSSGKDILEAKDAKLMVFTDKSGDKVLFSPKNGVLFSSEKENFELL